MKDQLISRILISSLLLMLLTACAAGTPIAAVSQSPTLIASTATQESIVSATKVLETPTLVLTSLPTGTATILPTATIIPTAAPTFAPTPELVIPDLYPVNECVSTYVNHFKSDFEGPDPYTVDFCVVSVLVKPNRHLVFNVSWTPGGHPEGGWVKLGSYQKNTKVFVTDNLGNRYDPISLGGAAGSWVTIKYGWTTDGSFEFKAPPTHALHFSFHDDNYQILINNINLDVIPIEYKVYALTDTRYTAEYNQEIWQEAAAKTGQNELVNLKIQDCKIQSVPNGDPQGTYKNTLAIRDITYKIYGYLDKNNRLAYRYYYAIDGLTGLSETTPVAFFVTIPLSQADACLGSVSTVLMNLKANTGE